MRLKIFEVSFKDLFIDKISFVLSIPFFNSLIFFTFVSNPVVLKFFDNSFTEVDQHSPIQ